MVWNANTEGQVEYANRRWYEYTGLAESGSETAHLGWDVSSIRRTASERGGAWNARP